MKYMIAIIALFTLAIGFSYAYAEQQAMVTLPFDRPYETLNCSTSTQLQSEQDGLRTVMIYYCSWFWSISEEGLEQIPVQPSLAGIDYDVWLEEVIPIVENNPFRESDPTIDLFPQPPVKSVEEELRERLDPEVRKAIEKLGECRFGLEGWAAFQAQINFTVPDELPIFTSGLDKRPLLGKLAKAFEACRIQKDYPLSQQYEDIFLADLLGLDLYKRQQTNFGLDERRLYEEQRTASDEEISKAAQDARDWMCGDENLHLKLCSAYMELQGENRGNPEPIVDEKLYNEYLTAQAARDLTAADREKVLNNAILLMCEIYTQQYAHLIRTDALGNVTYEGYPDWLMQCHE